MEFRYISLRDHIGSLLIKNDCPEMTVLDSDLAKSTTSVAYKERFPEKFVECGISEASAMSIASGLATEGRKPVIVNFSMFIIGSAWTQLRQACYADLNIVMIGTHPGMDNGPDGASHHANEDLALARVLPNLKVLVPDCLNDLDESIRLALETRGPVYIRCSRDAVPAQGLDREAISFSRVKVVCDEGDEIAIIYEGTAAKAALEGFQKLQAQRIAARLVGINSLKPIDKAYLADLAVRVKGIVTVENHSVIAGLGGAVAEVLAELPYHAAMRRVGVNDVFTESGITAEVKEKYGLTGDHVYREAMDILERRRKGMGERTV